MSANNTFVSSLDFQFPNEPDGLSEVDGDAASGSAVSTGSGPPGAGGIKGRNTAAVVRPSARASKTNALAALTTRIEKPARTPDAAESSKRNPTRKAKEPRAPPLDFSTLRTSAPTLPNPPPRPPGRPTRMFGLEHAPVYYPTVEEFAKPMEYIEHIAPEAKEFGICKIVPPAGWRPPFALNTETFRFKTRLQRLNSMEASARASLNFLEQLYIFHRQQGSTGIAVPTLGGKPLDLWRLKREVNDLGGYVKVARVLIRKGESHGLTIQSSPQVTSGRKWTAVAKSMGYATQSSTAICSQLKTTYSKMVVPFEDYVKRVKLAGGTPPPDPSILHDDAPTTASATKSSSAASPKTDGAESLATPRSDSDDTERPEFSFVAIDKVRTASDKLNEALDSGSKPVASSSKSSNLLPATSAKAAFDETPGEVCEICTKDHDPDKIVLCDGCDRGFHLTCLSPPLSEVPLSQFFCDTCLFMNGAEYGFEEGQDHSLHSFRKRADAFKRSWLDNHPLPPFSSRNQAERSNDAAGSEQDMMDEQLAIEDHFEREFWRLVESQDENVEVEYGADVNSTNNGGGMPNLEVHPNDPYSRDGWNLNNLPILPGSLLRYIKSDISGMTIPWIYVGMVFSTFAWHKEDHYTYRYGKVPSREVYATDHVSFAHSINYHQFGDTKTWYGIPGADDEKLEAAMKLAAPELFEQQPDLMFQLVTLMSPGRLKKHGVRVVACDQRPNEFIITFPRGYHSGFNHGFNFNEAVNFALPDWLPTGLKCVKRYQGIKKNPVFSHDELLVTISQHEKSPKSSQWLVPRQQFCIIVSSSECWSRLHPNWKEMTDRELATREKARRLHPGMEEVIDATEIEEELYQCETCRGLSFLSHVTTTVGTTTHIACPHHAVLLPEGTKVFRLRYTDEELLAMLAKVKARSDKGGRARQSLGELGFDQDQRTTGRKRKPSALAMEAMEAAGDDPPPPFTKPRINQDVSTIYSEHTNAHSVPSLYQHLDTPYSPESRAGPHLHPPRGDEASPPMLH
ncbi:[histone H3]-trimethyl-L-lysine4 demethylase, partial [Phenoliferia sp. Uapishka_3]